MPRIKRKKGRYILAFLAIISAILLFGYFKYNSYIYDPMDPQDDTNISFLIKKGETVKEIAKNLEENELIKSNKAFYYYVRFNNMDKNIVSGRFLINKTMNIPDIIAIISDPSKAEAIITIQEGITIRDIDEKLVELGLLEEGEFIQAIKDFEGWEYYTFLEPEKLKELEIPLEGYIFPDTYFLDPIDFKPHDLIYLAMDNYEKKIQSLEEELGLEISYDTLIMASIVENEVTSKEDRELVASILWKRLDNDWTLGADATLLYITEDRDITVEELETDSPYNTRKNKGLPPGPISNPSLESIRASVKELAKDTKYWFYLTTPDTGEVIYAETNEEHNQNREKYL